MLFSVFIYLVLSISKCVCLSAANNSEHVMLLEKPVRYTLNIKTSTENVSNTLPIRVKRAVWNNLESYISPTFFDGRTFFALLGRTFVYNIVGNSLQSYLDVKSDLYDDFMFESATKFVKKNICDNQLMNLVYALSEFKFVRIVDFDCPRILKWTKNYMGRHGCKVTNHKNSTYMMCDVDDASVQFYHTDIFPYDIVKCHNEIKCDYERVLMKLTIYNDEIYPQPYIESRSLICRLAFYKKSTDGLGYIIAYHVSYKRSNVNTNFWIYIDKSVIFGDSVRPDFYNIFNYWKSKLHPNFKNIPMPTTLNDLNRVSESEIRNLFSYYVSSFNYNSIYLSAHLNSTIEAASTRLWEERLTKFYDNLVKYGPADFIINLLFLASEGTFWIFVPLFAEAYNTNPGGDMRDGVAAIKTLAKFSHENY